MTTERQVIEKAETESDEGATMVEYALLVLLIAMIALAALRFLGQTVSVQFSEIAESVDGVM